MAVTFTTTVEKVFVVGDRKEVLASVACSGVPTSGGDTYDVATDLGLDLEVNDVQVGNLLLSDGTTAVVASVYESSDVWKVTFHYQAVAGSNTALAEFGGNTNLGGTSQMRVRAIGKGKAAA